jgi:hypothetical protein
MGLYWYVITVREEFLTEADDLFQTYYDVEDGKDLVVNVTSQAIALAGLNVYDRWVGRLEGRFGNDTETLTGVASYEEFKV